MENERREQFARLVNFLDAVCEYQSCATHRDVLEDNDLTGICGFLNGLLAIDELVKNQGGLRFAEWSDAALAAFHDVAVIVKDILEGLKLASAIAAVEKTVIEICKGQHPPRFCLHFETQPKYDDNEEVVDDFDGFDRIELRSELLAYNTPSERPFRETVAFHPLDDSQFLHLVRCLAVVATELSKTIPSRHDPGFLLKTINSDGAREFIPTKLQTDILRALDGRALEKQPLADTACAGDASRLYKPGKGKPGGLHELRALGKVEHRRGVGYFRPDRPPKSV